MSRSIFILFLMDVLRLSCSNPLRLNNASMVPSAYISAYPSKGNITPPTSRSSPAGLPRDYGKTAQNVTSCILWGEYVRDLADQRLYDRGVISTARSPAAGTETGIWNAMHIYIVNSLPPSPRFGAAERRVTGRSMISHTLSILLIDRGASLRTQRKE